MCYICIVKYNEEIYVRFAKSDTIHIITLVFISMRRYYSNDDDVLNYWLIGMVLTKLLIMMVASFRKGWNFCQKTEKLNDKKWIFYHINWVHQLMVKGQDGKNYIVLKLIKEYLKMFEFYTDSG